MCIRDSCSGPPPALRSRPAFERDLTWPGCWPAPALSPTRTPSPHRRRPNPAPGESADPAFPPPHSRAEVPIPRTSPQPRAHTEPAPHSDPAPTATAPHTEPAPTAIARAEKVDDLSLGRSRLIEQAKDRRPLPTQPPVAPTLATFSGTEQRLDRRRQLRHVINHEVGSRQLRPGGDAAGEADARHTGSSRGGHPVR